MEGEQINWEELPLNGQAKHKPRMKPHSVNCDRKETVLLETTSFTTVKP